MKNGEQFRAAIIIPTYNGMRTLPFLIESLKNQNSGDFVTLVVDSSSTDGTYEFLRENCDDVIQIPSSDFDHGGSRDWQIQTSI